MKKIIVLSGSIREGRKSHFVAQYIVEELSKNKTIATTLLDLKKYPLPIMEQRMGQATQSPEGLEAFSHILSQAQGIIIVSPEYKNGIPGALKNSLDYLNPQVFKHIPIGIATVTSGKFGGLHCLSQLRTVTLALGGLPIPEKLCVSSINEVFDVFGTLQEASFNKKVREFIKAFLWYAERLSI